MHRAAATGHRRAAPSIPPGGTARSIPAATAAPRAGTDPAAAGSAAGNQRLGHTTLWEALAADELRLLLTHLGKHAGSCASSRSGRAGLWHT